MSYFFTKAYETKLFKKDDYNNILVENFLDGIILLNLNLEIMLLNSKALKIFTSEFPNIYQTNFLNYFDFNFRKTFLSQLEELIFPKNYLQLKNYKELSLIYEQGSKNRFLFIFKIALRKQLVIGIIIYIKNINEKIYLTKKNRFFLRNICHELRTPLFNIQSFTQTLETSLESFQEEEIKEFLQIINKEIVRLSQLINTILNISTFNYQNIYNLSPIAIEEIFNNLLEIYCIRLKEKKIKVIKEIKENLPCLLSKNDLMLQIFDNLIGNCVKFSDDNNTIIFRAYQVCNLKTSKIRIEIGDYGIGIIKHKQKNIFKKFFKLQKEKKIIYGNGLGLYITKKLVDKHKNSIYFTTEKNEGIIFFLDFDVS